MDSKMIIFSGAPATGKDTVTNRICEKLHNAVPFMKYRGMDVIEDKPTYFNISKGEFEDKIKNDEFIQYHERYGRYYGIAKHTLENYREGSKTPIIHAGRIENFKIIKEFDPKNSVSILLWCDLSEIIDRLKIRHGDGSPEIEARRLAALEEYEEWYQNSDYLENVDLVIKNLDLDNTSNLILDKISGNQTNYNHEVEVNRFKQYLKELFENS
jgi:guanylate kinase